MKEIIQGIVHRIHDAAIGAGRNPSEIKLVAVTKTVPADIIKMAIESGIRMIGENYVQEAREKFAFIGKGLAEWHFIGHLQRNKAKYAVEMFDLIHSVDSFRLAEAIDREAHKIGKIQPILIQINIGKEASKSGISTESVRDLVKAVSTLPHVAIKGLMTLPPFFNSPEKVRPFFHRMKTIRDEISSLSIENVDMRELSMGMTGDFEAAVEEGATFVRIGTAIFGERS